MARDRLMAGRVPPAALLLMCVMGVISLSQLAHAQSVSDVTTLQRGLPTRAGVPFAVTVTGFSPLSSPAFPVINVGSQSRTFVAAARLGQGHVVALGNQDILNNCATIPNYSLCTIVRNAIGWKSRPAPLRAAGSNSLYETIFTDVLTAGQTIQYNSNAAGVGGSYTLTPAAFTAAVASQGAANIPLDVYVLNVNDQADWTDTAFVSALTSFVRAGGGVLVGGQCFSFLTSPERTVASCPGNTFLSTLGMPLSGTTAVVARTTTLILASPPIITDTSSPPPPPPDIQSPPPPPPATETPTVTPTPTPTPTPSTNLTLTQTSYNENWRQLTAGLPAVRVPSVLFPSPLAIWGAAFPIFQARDESLVMAASQSTQGTGRVVVYGHDSYVTEAPNIPFLQSLLTNAVRWAARLSTRPANRRLRLATSLEIPRTVVNVLQRVFPNTFELYTQSPSGQQFRQPYVSPSEMVEHGSAIDVWITTPLDVEGYGTANVTQAIEAFVERGGALIMAGQAWSWGLTNPNGDARIRFPPNQALAKYGITILNDFLDGSTGLQTTQPSILNNFNLCADFILRSIIRVPQANGAQIMTVLSKLSRQLMGALRKDAPAAYDTLDTAVSESGVTNYALGAPGVAPLPYRDTTDVNVRRSIWVTYSTLRALRSPVGSADFAANALTSAFPGAPPANTARLQNFAVQVNFTYARAPPPYPESVSFGIPAWRSTGLYAPPGAIVTVTLPQAVVGRVSIQVGSHTDLLWNRNDPLTETAQYRRAPQVVRSFKVNSTTMQVGSAFGGLLYVLLDQEMSENVRQVTFSNVVRAPWFVKGRDTNAQWISTIRNFPAPWAELQTGTVIITVPTSVARTIANPQGLMDFYDRMMNAQADLAALPTRFRARAERYVYDAQILAGLFHAGYPIMGPLHLAPDAVNLTSTTDVNKLRVDGTWWGIFHEVSREEKLMEEDPMGTQQPIFNPPMGHQHQYGQYAGMVISSTIEVTCNWFTTFVMGNVTPAVNLGWRTPAERAATRDDWLRRPNRNMLRWDPFTGLEMYLELRDGFGWEFFKAMHRVYQAIPLSTIVTDDAGKQDLWVSTACNVANANLEPFHRKWGWLSITQSTRDSCARQPAWTQDPTRAFPG